MHPPAKPENELIKFSVRARMRPVLAGIIMMSPMTDTDPADIRAARVRKALRDQPGVLIHERAPGEVGDAELVEVVGLEQHVERVDPHEPRQVGDWSSPLRGSLTSAAL